MTELIDIQSELKAPKSQYNKFGGYNYRSAEDILEALKPLLKKHGCYLTISDEIVPISDRVYVKATVTITSADKSVSVSAFAREEETKKGQDGAQITGSASSYARKYALNGLFCIDDTKDPDGTNTHGKEEPKKEAPKKESIDKDLQEALKGIASSEDIKSLMFVWETYKSLQSNPQFKKAIGARKNELK